MYKTILVPHAGTKAGDESLRHAIYLAGSSGKIILLHVVEEIQRPPTFALSSSEQRKILNSIRSANESLRQDMEKVIQEKVEMCRKSKVPFESFVVIGSPADEILKIVKNKKVDIIVMAKRRKLKGVKKLLGMGSVSRKIAENVSCPVLLIDIEKP
ncbi:MAG: universal stress protein [Nitrosarchaeum sp.]|nr:universal stress protein [Nitrosarchaeum sp.]MCV0398386.1 universal stress protein [Nitrosarchaeum sp.]